MAEYADAEDIIGVEHPDFKIHPPFDAEPMAALAYVAGATIMLGAVTARLHNLKSSLSPSQAQEFVVLVSELTDQLEEQTTTIPDTRKND